MKWAYEKLTKAFDKIIDDYLDEKISFAEKEEQEKILFNCSGWTWDEMMYQCESQIQ